MNTLHQDWNKTALLIVDVQRGFDNPIWGKRNNLNAEKNIQRLLEFWRAQNRPVIHVQHSSKTRMAANLDFEVFLVADATATFGKSGINGEKYEPEIIHAVHLASLNGEFCQVVSTESLIG